MSSEMLPDLFLWLVLDEENYRIDTSSLKFFYCLQWNSQQAVTILKINSTECLPKLSLSSWISNNNTIFNKIVYTKNASSWLSLDYNP